MEELAAVVAARHKAILAAVETAVEETETEQVVGLLAKQKEWAEGKRLVCDHCTTPGFDCQVSPMADLFGFFSDNDGR